MIRDARMEDVKVMYALLQHFANKGLLLGRSLSSLYDQLRDFKVFVGKGPEGGGEERILGICALHVCWENLAEIRSLAVVEEAQRQGIGRSLIAACLAEADHFGIGRVFTLTYQPDFFRRMGFRHIDKNELPHKVWSDCIHCPKFPDCNEEALLWERLEGGAPLPGDSPTSLE
jgi:amino-acid N-acetyltransferase